MDFPKKYTPQDYPLHREKIRTQKTSETRYTGIVPPGRFSGNFPLDHLHAMICEDTLVRYHMLSGEAIFTIPTTSYVSEDLYTSASSLLKKGKKTLSLEDVTEEWQKEYATRADMQYKNLAILSSVDRSRTTLDPDFQEFVERTFLDLYEKGYITYEESLVSYSGARGSVIAESEVKHEEKEGRWYHIVYFVSGSDAELHIVTDKPETIFADVAVAVHPKDKRYKKLIGKNIIIPALNKAIPIIGDTRVDMGANDGIRRITPSLSRQDLELARDHELQTNLSIIDKKGFITPEAGIFVGQKAETEARENTVELLRSKGNLIQIEVGNITETQCRETSCRIEHIISREWFVKGNILKERVIAGYNDAEFCISENGKKRFESALLEAHDWCISRTGNIGITIPAYFHKETDELLGVTRNPEKLIKEYGEDLIVQEKRTLDTYFLDVLMFLFCARGTKTKDETCTPVSHTTLPMRMIELWNIPVMMLGYECTGETPISFLSYIDENSSEILLEEGIKKYGSDTMRLAILHENITEDSLQEYFHFLSKLWNIVRFISLEVGPIGDYSEILEHIKKAEKNLLPYEYWTLTELAHTTEKIHECMTEEYSRDAFQIFARMLTEKFAPITLEAYKTQSSPEGKNILALGVHWLLFFAELFTPSIRNILHELAVQENAELFSGEIFWSTDEKHDIYAVIEIINTIRQIRGKYHIKPQDITDILIVSEITNQLVLEENEELIRGLTHAGKITIVAKKPNTRFQGYGLSGNTEIYVDIPSYEENIREELAHLETIIEEKKLYIRTLSDKLGDNTFLQNAPDHIVRTEMQKRHIAVEQMKKFEEKRKELEKRQ